MRRAGGKKRPSVYSARRPLGAPFRVAGSSLGKDGARGGRGGGQSRDHGIFAPAPRTLPLLSELAELAFHHRDPFDRLLIAQAMVENVPLVSKDEQFDRYRIRRVW